MRWGKPPSSFVVGTDRRKWSNWDIVVAEAYEIVQRERCSNCGLPIWMCHNDSEQIQFPPRLDECHAKASVERKEEKLKDADRKPGARYVPVPKMLDGSDPISLRESYYKAEQKKSESRE